MHAIESYTVKNIDKKTVTQCILQKLLLTYYLNISVQVANLSDCRIESNRKIDLVARIESKLFLPELECSSAQLSYTT